MKKVKMICVCCLTLLLAACEKDTESINFAPTVTTGNATDIYRKGATLSGNIQLTGATTAESYGILFSKLKSMAESSEYPISTEETEYKVRVQNLEPGTTYYYCAYANSGYSTSLGEIKTFTTTENNAPVFGSLSIDSIGADRVFLSTDILDDGGAEMIISGFCWKEGNTGVATYIDNVMNVSEIENDKISAVITGLKPETDYVFSAYSVNTHGMGFSESYVIRTGETKVPALSDITITTLTDYSIRLQAQIIDFGTSDIIEAGLCWSKENSEPTKDDNTLDLTENLVENDYWMYVRGSNLTPNATYYYRFYAVNEDGIGYSKVLSFTTPEDANWEVNIPGLPTHDWE